MELDKLRQLAEGDLEGALSVRKQIMLGSHEKVFFHLQRSIAASLLYLVKARESEAAGSSK